MADSAPAATKHRESDPVDPVIGSPRSWLHHAGFHFHVSNPPQISQLIPDFLVAAIVEHSNQKMALFPCGMLLAIWAIVGLRLSLC